jgi:hypothetical protein
LPAISAKPWPEALADYGRDELLEILTYVFKEYVVEGPPPLLVSQTERIEELEGLGFADLISALQTRLDLPELSLFSVDGQQVSVRVGGVMTPLTPAGGERPAPTPAPAARPPAPQPELRRGVNIVETGPMQRPANPSAPRPAVDEAVARGRGDLAGLDQRRGTAPRPTGLSVRGRPGAPGGGGVMAPEPAPAGGRAADEPAADSEAPPEPPDKPAEPAADGDDASVRFSLLELD